MWMIIENLNLEVQWKSWYYHIPFFSGVTASGLGRLIGEVSSSHTIRHTLTAPVGLLWTSDQLVSEAATHTTHNKHKRRKNIYAVSWIQACDPNNQETADFCLRPHGHRSRLPCFITFK
jgi:hypothetical protein